MGSYDAPNISKDKIQTHKGSKECYLLWQDTCEFSGYAHVSSFKTKCPFSPSLCHNKYHFLKTFYMFGSCFRMLAVILVWDFLATYQKIRQHWVNVMYVCIHVHVCDIYMSWAKCGDSWLYSPFFILPPKQSSALCVVKIEQRHRHDWYSGWSLCGEAVACIVYVCKVRNIVWVCFHSSII